MDFRDWNKPPDSSEVYTHQQRHEEKSQQLISGGGKGIWWEISNWLIIAGIFLVIFLIFKYVF
ncbi:hypothetical protein HUB98_07755 [Paenibacillus barcinonensis]|uniref:Uncharacterized protein n=1 Tax=Paenibacillus barcinonensis TaxID=198119 RepID=A0A2V4UZQ2_PAEBA|nr:hypothetical protein [Paenibacillus barcinonensis]PYE45667.1 hypothetical protein DFQ00_1179 [Paenibacillus barcinonensis]QKS56249.1 hypothetical protein HUB98_07755 [Paenibacillus barcinonensis]